VVAHPGDEGCGGRLPVVDAEGALVGVLESDDVLAWFAKKIGY